MPLNRGLVVCALCVRAVLAQAMDSSPAQIFRSTLFQLKQASSELSSVCTQVSTQKVALQSKVGEEQKKISTKRDAAQRLMMRDSRISGMPVSSLDPADYGMDKSAPDRQILSRDLASMHELQRFSEICQASLPVLTQSIAYLEKPLTPACHRASRTPGAASISATPLSVAGLRLRVATKRLKCINLPLKASVLLKVSDKVLSVFDKQQKLLASDNLLQPISAVRASLDSVVVMASELSKMSKQLVLQVWALQSQVQKMQSSEQAKVLADAFSRGSTFANLAREYVAEKKIFTQMYEMCKNMTGGQVNMQFSR